MSFLDVTSHRARLTGFKDHATRFTNHIRLYHRKLVTPLPGPIIRTSRMQNLESTFFLSRNNSLLHSFLMGHAVEEEKRFLLFVYSIFFQKLKDVFTRRGSAPGKPSFSQRSSGYWAPAASASSLQCVDAKSKARPFYVGHERRATIGLRELRPSSRVIDWRWNFATDWIFFAFQYRYSSVPLESVWRDVCMARRKIGFAPPDYPEGTVGHIKASTVLQSEVLSAAARGL